MFLCYGDFIGTTIFGHSEAGDYIKILAWLCPFMYLSITLGSVLHGLGKTNTAFIHNVIGTVIKLFCLWFVVPVIGITGYLWGLLISNLVITFLHGFYIFKKIHFSFSATDNIIKPSAWLFCSIVAGKLINYILGFSSFSGKIFDIGKALLSAGVVFFVFLYFLRKEMKYSRI